MQFICLARELLGHKALVPEYGKSWPAHPVLDMGQMFSIQLLTKGTIIYAVLHAVQARGR